MKLNSFQLESHLAKQLASIYLISGEDILLKQDAHQLIRKAAKKSGFNERTRIVAESGLTEEQLYSLFYSTSFLAEKRLLELDFRETMPTKMIGQLLQQYAEKPASDYILVINSGKIDSKSAKSSWYQTLEKMGIVIAIWPISREQLPQWIQQRARKFKLQFEPTAANLLAEYVEGNLIAAAQAIEKLVLLKPTTPIHADLVKSLITDESHFTVFDCIETIIAGDISRTLHILETLKAAGTEPTLMVWALTRELRLLARMAEQLEQGKTLMHIFQVERIFARRQTAFRHFLAHFTAIDCWHFITHLADIDGMIKGAVSGDSWESLQLFCLRLTTH